MAVRKDHDQELHQGIRDLDGDGEADSASELLRWLGIAIAVIVATFWLSAQFAALVHGFDWMPPARSILALPEAFMGVFQHPFDTQQAWPADLQPLAPAWWVLWPCLMLGYGIVISLVWQFWKYKRQKNRELRDTTGWAHDDEIKKLLAPRSRLGKKRDGTVLGLTQRSHRKVIIDRETHIVMIAGSGTGKTAGMCIPAMLEHDGVILATSVKDDLVKNTIEYRRTVGDVMVFDPMESLGYDDDKIHSWTPLASASSWPLAQEIARSLIDSSGSSKGGGNSEFWNSMAMQTLPVLLYAAAIMEEDMRRVIRWLMRINDESVHQEVDSILRWRAQFDEYRQEASAALDNWVSFVTKEGQLRGNISATIAGCLVSYEDMRVQKNAMSRDITPERLFNGGKNTLYVVAPVTAQKRLEPIFVALMESLLMWVQAQPRPLDTPLLVVLDEAANIAALPQLPTILSTIRSNNVQVITAWQTISQIKNRYGEQMGEVLGNSQAKLVLSGTSDTETISYFNGIVGETLKKSYSTSRNKKQEKDSASISISSQRQALVTASTLREMKDNTGICVYRNLPPIKIDLRMYFKDRMLYARAGGPGIFPLYWHPLVGKYVRFVVDNVRKTRKKIQGRKTVEATLAPKPELIDLDAEIEALENLDEDDLSLEEDVITA